MARDHTALTHVYDTHKGLVFGLARRVLGDEAFAEDVTQEVFAFLWTEPERFDPARGTLRAWLGLLAHRRSVDRVRREARRARNETLTEGAEATVETHTEIDDELARGWVAGCVREALAQLPNEQRAAVELAYFGGRTYRQVASDLAIPEGTAKSRLRLALAKLEELLRPAMMAQDVLA